MRCIANSEKTNYNVSEANIYLNKYNFRPNETIIVNYTAPSSVGKTAWIGIVPADVQHGSEAINDQNDIANHHLNRKKTGVLRFTAPTTPRLYDFRMNDNDNNGREVTSISFNVR